MTADLIASGKYVVPGYIHAEIGVRVIGGTLPAWVDTTLPVDEEPDREIVLPHDPLLLADANGPARQAFAASRPRFRFIVAGSRLAKIVPAYYHIMALGQDDHLSLLAEGLAALAAGILLVGLDLDDVLSAAEAQLTFGDPGEPGPLGSGLALKGMETGKNAPAAQDILRALAYQKFDAAVLVIQMVSAADMPDFSLTRLDAFFNQMTKDKFAKNYFVTAAQASQSGIVVIAF